VSCTCLIVFPPERIANSAFEIVTRLNKDHFPAIIQYGSFADLTVCITEFCKVSKYQKISLLAIAMLRGVIPVMLECPKCPLAAENPPTEDSLIKFWFPVLFGFYDIIMNGEDLEVRRLYVPDFEVYRVEPLILL
jgi:brefeldin A-inhibited guanine nucleotide-exchange protein